MTAGEFQSQLNYLKNSLLSLYKQKTKLISQREALRFKYVTALRTQFQTIVSSMLQDGYNAQNTYGIDLLNALIKLIKSSIPMTNVAGENIDGWQYNPNSPGGIGAGVLSPIENYLVKPFMPDTTEPTWADKTAYQLYGSRYWDINIDEFIRNYFTDNEWYLQAGDNTPFTYPPSRSWTEQYIAKYGAGYGVNGASILEHMDEAYLFVEAIMGKKYSIGTLEGTVTALKETIISLIKQMKYILSLQDNIVLAEANLNDFVSTYQEYMNGVQLSDILLQLQMEADASNTMPQLEEPEAQVVTAQGEVAQPKSKLPWIIAAGIIGAMTLGGKSK